MERYQDQCQLIITLHNLYISLKNSIIFAYVLKHQLHGSRLLILAVVL
jgi:hypothetical protein